MLTLCPAIISRFGLTIFDADAGFKLILTRTPGYLRTFPIVYRRPTGSVRFVTDFTFLRTAA